ncbi:MAG: DUF2065 domain-containing protein, partial [Rhizobiaceae bacterium]
MSDLIVALGLALVLEGLLWGGFPGAGRDMARRMAELPDGVLRGAGLAAMAFG